MQLGKQNRLCLQDFVMAIEYRRETTPGVLVRRGLRGQGIKAGAHGRPRGRESKFSVPVDLLQAQAVGLP
jgi:hypothetical protein